jgi:hypothetical protein
MCGWPEKRRLCFNPKIGFPIQCDAWSAFFSAFSSRHARLDAICRISRPVRRAATGLGLATWSG